MQQSSINIDVLLNAEKVPEQISWNVSANSDEKAKIAKAMMVAFWDGADKTALRIDLWTKDMMVDEMGDFFYQTLMTMADSFLKATRQKELVEDMKKFAKEFYAKFREEQLRENKL